METSTDSLLGGHLRLTQPKDGYRAAIDPVLLAASIPADVGHDVLDLGCGVGAAALCLAVRLPKVRITGIELQEELVFLARNNVTANSLSGRVMVEHGDIVRPPPFLPPASFDHVMANPPYLPADRGRASPHPGRAKANVEGEADLATWVNAAIRFAKPKGCVTFIQRADRLDELLGLFSGRLGAIVVFPFWPKPGAAAGRVLVRGWKGRRTPLTLSPGMVLHNADGGYTPDAEAVLRNAFALRID